MPAGFEPTQITPSQYIDDLEIKISEIYSNKKGFKFNDLKPFCFVEMTGQMSNSFNRASLDEAHQNEKPTVAKAMVGEVGTTRFELATPCTPCKCATGLRYVPKLYQASTPP
jgi:hypothetical protein